MPIKTVARLPLGAGIPVPDIIMATFTIPSGCSCTWTVTRRGLGMKMLSQLRWSNALCPVQRQHQPGQPGVMARTGRGLT